MRKILLIEGQLTAMRKTICLSLTGMFIVFAIIFFTACKKDNPSSPAPTITDFTPKSDTAGALVLITGTNFSTTLSQNSVAFNGIAATVTSATATELIVVVPAGVQNGPITVTVGGQTATSSVSFTKLVPALPPPTITSFLPDIAGIGYPFVVNGTNFSTDTSKNIVAVNGVTARDSLATPTQLLSFVPVGATSGKISVTVDGQAVSSFSSMQIKTLTSITMAGTGASGSNDGAGNVATFSGVWSATPDGNGNYYISDPNNSRIRKMTSDGTVSTYTGSAGFGNTNGNLTTAKFGSPYDVAFDNLGNMYVSDLAMNNIRKIAPDGTVTNFAGDIAGNHGLTDATGAAARFNSPMGLAVDANNNVFVVDDGNSSIRKITSAGVVTTLAGIGSTGSADGTGAAASFNSPYSIAIDGSGNLYVTDAGNFKIRRITQAGVVTTFAGSGNTGIADGPAATASFTSPAGITIDATGNFWVTDRIHGRIRMISPAGIVYTLAGNGLDASIDGVGYFSSFSNPLGIDADAGGVLIVVDNATNKIRKITVQ
jgi:sugar lactone lactonase YvrE